MDVATAEQILAHPIPPGRRAPLNSAPNSTRSWRGKRSDEGWSTAPAGSWPPPRRRTLTARRTGSGRSASLAARRPLFRHPHGVNQASAWIRHRQARWSRNVELRSITPRFPTATLYVRVIGTIRASGMSWTFQAASQPVERQAAVRPLMSTGHHRMLATAAIVLALSVSIARRPKPVSPPDPG
jgi:hypothetical protein